MEDARYAPDDPHMTGASWVDVRDEPMHRRRFENELVRVYDVLVPPGRRSLYHRHSEHTVYVAVADALAEQQTLGKPLGEATVSCGLNFCADHRAKPLIHQVGNRGTGDMRLIGIEVAATAPVAPAEPLSGPHLRMGTDAARVRTYRLSLPPGEAADLAAWGVLVLLGEGCLQLGSAGWQSLSASAGDVLWRAGGDEALRNVGETAVEAVFVELKGAA